MMPKFLLKIIFLLVLLILTKQIQAQAIQADQDTQNVWEIPNNPPPTEVKLLEELSKELNKSYPGFRLAEKKDYCPNYLGQHLQLAGLNPGETLAYGALSRDFNGDALADYALILYYQEKFILVSALKNAASAPAYHLKTLNSAMVSAGERTPSREIRGQICTGILKTGPSQDMPIPIDNSTTSLNPYPYLGMFNASSAMLFYYEDGAWQKTGYEP